MKESPERPGAISRRAFVQTSAATAAALSAPLVIPSRLLGKDAPSNRDPRRPHRRGPHRAGPRHARRRGRRTSPTSLAVCDLDSRRAASGKTRVERAASPNAQRAARRRSRVYQRLPRAARAQRHRRGRRSACPTTSTPRSRCAALHAGKDVYLQKPFTMTHAEGVHPARRRGADGPHPAGRAASSARGGRTSSSGRRVELVRSGRVGNLQARRDRPAHRPHRAGRSGAAGAAEPELRHVARARRPRCTTPSSACIRRALERDGEPDVNSRPGWLRNESYCLGMITGWGAHHFDTAHWGMDMELTGPLKIEGKGEFPTEQDLERARRVRDRARPIPGNVMMRVSDKLPNGIKFIGDEGWIFVSRDALADGERSAGRADVAQVARRERPEAARSRTA